MAMAFLLNQALAFRGTTAVVIRPVCSSIHIIYKYPELVSVIICVFSTGGNSAILRVNGSKCVGFPAVSPEVIGAGKEGGFQFWSFIVVVLILLNAA